LARAKRDGELAQSEARKNLLSKGRGQSGLADKRKKKKDKKKKRKKEFK
jgi:hypothetical protein